MKGLLGGIEIKVVKTVSIMLFIIWLSLVPTGKAVESGVTASSIVINGQSLNLTNPEITVTPGQTIQGSINATNCEGSTCGGCCINPIVGAISWNTDNYTGITNYCLNNDCQDFTWQFTYTAPTTEGTYYIAVLRDACYSYSDIVYCTNGCCTGCGSLWDDSNWSDGIGCRINNNLLIVKIIVSAGAQPPSISGIQQFPELPTYNDDVTISATVTDDTGLSSVKLYYSINNGAFNSVDMTNVGSTYSATIPKQSIGTNITYYIEAIDINGSANQSGKYSYYSVQKVVQVAVILTKFSDNIPAPTKDANYFRQEIIPNVVNYYYENSYGSIDFNFTIYDNSSDYYSLPQNHDYYGGNHLIPQWCVVTLDTEKKVCFLWDAIAQADYNIDYDNYDSIIVVHAGNSEQANEGDDSDIQTAHLSLDLTTQTTDGFSDIAKNSITIAENDPYGTWAHELGHALGKILQGKVLPDRYKSYWYEELIIPQEIWYWGLMGHGNWLNPPVHMCSYSKEFLGWLEYDFIEVGSYTVPMLPKLKYGDKIFAYKYNPFWENYYILEARANNSKYSNFDINTPYFDINDPYSGGHGVVIYKVDTTIFGEKVNSLFNQEYHSWSVPTLSKLLNESYSNPDIYVDIKNKIKFSLIKENDTTNGYQALVKIERIEPTNLNGLTINPSVNAIIQNLSFMSDINKTYADIDMHAYSSDGNHTGMNYSSGKYENQIQDAVVSGDLVMGEEWIFVPSNITVEFKVSSYDVQKYLEDANKTNESLEINYSITTIRYDENAAKLESKSIATSISANKTSNITLPTKIYRSLEADDIVRNKTTLLNKELKVPVVVTAVYGDRYYVTNGKTGFMVFVNETPKVTEGSYVNIYGNISLEFNDTAIIASDFEELDNLTIDPFKKSLSTSEVVPEYLENGSVLINTTGTISSIGSDYIVINDGSGDTKIYFKYGISMPSTKTGDKINVTGVLINDSIGIIPIDQDSFSITFTDSQDGGTSSGGGGGGGDAPKCIKEGFQSLDIDLMKCLLRESRLQYKQFYTDATSVGRKTQQPKTIKLLASILAITGEKTGEYPAPSLDVESYLSKPMKPLEGDIFDLAKERILKRWAIANTVVVARGDLEVDSLAAVAYAKANRIPILLTKTDEIPSQTLDVLKKLNPKRIIIAGGPAAVSEEVEKELENYGKTERIWGKDRVETAIEIAKSMEEKYEIETIIVADGLSTKPEAAIIANNYKAPVVYVSGGEISEITKEFLKDHKRTKRYKKVMKVVFVGVSEEVQKEIEELMKVQE